MRIQRLEDPGPFTRHGDYKPHLQPVFRHRCAYCQTHEDRNGGLEGMTVDHFWCESRYPRLRLAWDNLYYSCFICNCCHKKDRPTEKELAAGDRFVDACREDPDDHFRLVRCPKTNQLCCIKALSDAGRFTLLTLKLHVRSQLRDYWRELERKELDERELLRAIDVSIEQLDIVVKERGSSTKVEIARRSLAAQRQTSLERLADALSRRPFPAEL